MKNEQMKRASRALGDLRNIHSSIVAEQIEDGGDCRAECGTGLMCTRGNGHDGYHVATGDDGSLYAIWKA